MSNTGWKLTSIICLGTVLGCTEGGITSSTTDISPNVSSSILSVGDTLQLNPSGGTPPYTFAVESGQATVTGSGLISANGQGAAQIRIGDSNEKEALVSLKIYPQIEVSPSDSSLSAFTDVSFSATGGSGSGFSFAIDFFSELLGAVTGSFVRPWASGTVSITATDSLGITKSKSYKLLPGSHFRAGASGDYTDAVIEDSQGSIYHFFESSVTLPGFTNAGQADIVIVKYDKNGKQQWAKQFGSSEWDWSSGHTFDELENPVFVFCPTVDWTHPGFTVTKYCNVISLNKSNGETRWIKSISSTVRTQCRSRRCLTAGDPGYLYFVGQAHAGVIEGQTSIGTQDNFIMKINSSTGTSVWIKFVNLVVNYEGTVSYDPAENALYMAGTTDGTLPGESSTGGRDFFIVKYDTNGNRLWHDQVPETGWSMYDVVGRKNGITYYCGVSGIQYTGAGWLNSHPSVLAYNSSGTRVFHKSYPELANGPDWLSTKCTVSDTGLYVTFLAALAPAGSTPDPGPRSDFYRILLNEQGTEVSRVQFPNSPLSYNLSQITSSGDVFFVATSSDLLDGQSTTINGEVDDFVCQAGQTCTRLGFRGATAANHYSDLTLTSANNLFVFTSTDGTIDNHSSSGGGGDQVLTKFNLDLVRQ